ncbi:MAG: YrhK family protein, partial [Pseudomonadota bacterium]
MFHPRVAPMSVEDMRRHALFEIAHTTADFCAALCFVVGSVMFFFSAWLIPGTWFFLVGSVLFALKPT